MNKKFVYQVGNNKKKQYYLFLDDSVWTETCGNAQCYGVI